MKNIQSLILQVGYEGNVNMQDGMQAGLNNKMAQMNQGQIGWNTEYPFPTGMPTQAEIAADLELDRQLLSNSSGSDFLKWQIW